ncbi:HDOD domain-containing protein [Desulfosoma caldarium]|uniref:Putative nucleotidyltransferase with HDIG domain n=1 Tax=Desulfosoma caldarium TaxID=610254 RepID=A0A3N1ULH9_9BACT|nr:HDOD domain-containing protein [Desulfosoma caldarium]ROQ92084.1 putative nucleotidyltransferase with HDIG domain [Desulfosoma caldarium]
MLPDTAFRVMDMMHKPDTDPKALARAVAEDPGLGAQTLHLCNSPYYSLPVEVTSIEHAVRLLGWPTVCGIVMAAYLYRLMARFSGDGARLWLRGARRHVLHVADCAQHLAVHAVLGLDRSEAWTLGLLHDIGKLVLAQLDAEAARAVEDRLAVSNMTLVDTEWEVLGADHAEVGSLLAERWELPDMIVDTIRWHHRPEKSEGPTAGLVFAADTLARVAEGLESWSAFMEDEPRLSLVLERLGMDRDGFISVARLWLESAKGR